MLLYTINTSCILRNIWIIHLTNQRTKANIELLQIEAPVKIKLCQMETLLPQHLTIYGHVPEATFQQHKYQNYIE